MNLTDDEVLKFQKGTPVLLEDICAVYPATVGEIVDIGYSNFQKFLGAMLAEKPVIIKDNDAELRKMMEELSDFQYLLILANMDVEIQTTLREAFRFFTHETQVVFSLEPSQIVIGPPEEKHLLTEEKFYDFRKLLKHMYFIEQDVDDIVIYKNDDVRTRAIKKRMRENREKLRKAKANKAQQEGNDLKFSDLLGSIAINHCNLNMRNIFDITYYSLHDQLKRMGWRDQFEINSRAAMAGAKLKQSQLKHWMRSIASSDKN